MCYEVEDCLFSVVDVGGLHGNRQSWIFRMDDVSALLYVVDISAYDIMMWEDSNTNRMRDSLEAFGKLCKLRFDSKLFFLLFNKVDVFEEKIKKIPLTVCFPEYNNNCMYYCPYFKFQKLIKFKIDILQT